MFRTRESEKVRKEIFAWSFILLSTLILYSWTPVSGQMPEFQAPEPKFVGCQYRAQYAPIARELGISFEEQPPGWITIYSKSDCDRLKAELRKTTVPTETPVAPLLPGVMKVNSVRGQVEIFRNGKVSPVRLDSEVGPGDIVRTGEDGIIGIVSKDGTAYLFGDTVFEFVGLEFDEPRIILPSEPPPSPWFEETFDPQSFELEIDEMEFWKEVGKDIVDFHLHNPPKYLWTCWRALNGDLTAIKNCPRDTIRFVWRGLAWFDEKMEKDFPYSTGMVVTPTAAITPSGTEFTVNVAEDGMTTVTALNGIVAVTDLTSRNSVLLEANKQLTISKTPGGLSQEEMLRRVVTIDPEAVERWWEPSALPAEIPTGVTLVGAYMLVGIVVLLVAIIVCVSIMRKRKHKKSQE